MRVEGPKCKNGKKNAKNVKGQTWPYFAIKISHILVFRDREKHEGGERRREEEEKKKKKAKKVWNCMDFV